MKKEKFLEGVQNWNNHLWLLYPALEATTGDVIELGLGHGSTQQLHDYCEDKRKLYSFDYVAEWVDKFKHLETDTHKLFHAPNWDDVHKNYPNPDVILIDHSPGERRWIDIELYANTAKIIVIHDSEPSATGYMLDKIWPLFKYRVDFESPGAWATAVSNFVNLKDIM